MPSATSLTSAERTAKQGELQRTKYVRPISPAKLNSPRLTRSLLLVLLPLTLILLAIFAGITYLYGCDVLHQQSLSHFSNTKANQSNPLLLYYGGEKSRPAVSLMRPALSGASAEMAMTQGTLVLVGYTWLESFQAVQVIQTARGLVGLTAQEGLSQNTLIIFVIILLISVAICSAIILGLIAARLTRPLGELAQDTADFVQQEIAQGSRSQTSIVADEEHPTKVKRPTMGKFVSHEVGRLANSILWMEHHIEDLSQQTEKQASLRADIAHTFVHISRAASLAPSVDEFLRQSLNLLVKNLRYDHVAVFLTSEIGDKGDAPGSVEQDEADLRAPITLRQSAGDSKIGRTHQRDLVSKAVATNRTQVSPLMEPAPPSTEGANSAQAEDRERSDAADIERPADKERPVDMILYQAVLPITLGSQVLGALSVITRAYPVRHIRPAPDGDLPTTADREHSSEAKRSDSSPLPATIMAELGALANTLGLGLQMLGLQLLTRTPSLTTPTFALSEAFRTSPGASETEVERRLTELEALWTISQSITIETDLNKLYRTIHEQVNRFTGEFSSFAIVLYDSTTDQVRVPYMYEEGRYVNIPPFPLGQGLSSIVIRSGQPLMLVEDTETQTRALGAITVGAPAKSWLGVPLRMGDDTFGLIIAQDLHQEHRFDEEDLRLFTAIAAQVAVVVHNARLLEASRRQAELERLVNEITARIRRSVDPQAILKTTAEELGSALGARRAQVRIDFRSEEEPPATGEIDSGRGQRASDRLGPERGDSSPE